MPGWGSVTTFPSTFGLKMQYISSEPAWLSWESCAADRPKRAAPKCGKSGASASLSGPLMLKSAPCFSTAAVVPRHPV